MAGGFSGLSATRILQVGDIHFPDWRSAIDRVDFKDTAFSSDLLRAISASAIQVVLRRLSENNYAKRYNFTALMGDITSRGDKLGFEKALKQLSPLLLPTIGSGETFVVPGNHDVNRDDAVKIGIDRKFDFLNDTLASQGWRKFPVRGISAFTGAGPVSIFLINSCLGCHEKHYMPSTIRDGVDKAIEDFLRKNTAPYVAVSFKATVALDAYYEQLDTPAFDDAALEQLSGALESLPAEMIPLIISHHNLLPQATPRIAPYAELVNGGRLRRTP